MALQLMTTAIVLCAAVAGCGPSGRMKVHSGETDPLIRTARPKKAVSQAKAVFFGRVESKKVVQVIALIDARIMKVIPEDGARVNKGDKLFVLGGEMAKIGLEGLRARLDANKRVLSSLKKQVSYMQKAFEKGLVTIRDLGRSKVSLAKAQANQVGLEFQYKAMYSAILVKSSITGIFFRKKMQGQDVMRGEVLARVEDPASVRVRAWIMTSNARDLVGAKAVIQGKPGSLSQAMVIARLPETNGTGAPQVWLEPVGRHAGLVPGMPVQGWVFLPGKTAVIVVLGSAIVFNNLQQAFVFVKTGRGYEKRRVSLGEWSNRGVQVLGGVGPDDLVVVKGAYELFYKSPRPED